MNSTKTPLTENFLEKNRKTGSQLPPVANLPKREDLERHRNITFPNENKELKNFLSRKKFYKREATFPCSSMPGLMVAQLSR